MSEFTMLMAESALRAAVLAGLAGLAMAALRVRDASVRGAVWSAAIVASLLMPLAVWLVPPVYWREAVASEVSAPVVLFGAAISSSSTSNAPSPSPIDWLLAIYVAGAAFGVARIGFALAWGWRLRQRSRHVELAAPVEIRESEAIEVPMTFGWLRPFVVLPAAAWRDWEPRKLEAVVLHERAHIERADFLVQTLAALHEAVYWFSPLAWWLRRKVAALAEQASDDRVLLAMNDSTYYAEVLFSFLGKPRLTSMAVPMARQGSAAAGRIDRILEEGRRLSRGTGAGSMAAIALFTGVALWGASAVSLAQAPPPVPPAPPAPPAQVAPAAPVAPPAPPAPPRDGATTTFWRHWNNHESEVIEMRPGRLDYERNGKRYRITDAKTLAEIKSLYAPVEQLGREQAELGSRQAKLGAEQAALGERQAGVAVETRNLDAKVAAQMDKIRAMARKKTLTQEELGDMQSRLGELQEQLAQLQEHAGHSQGKLGEEQGKLGSEQGRLGDRQAQLGKKQAEAPAKADDAVRKLIEQAIKDGRAKPVVE